MYWDRQLNWEQQPEKLLKKLNTACFMLGKLQYLISEQALRMVYFISLNLNTALYFGVLPVLIKVYLLPKKRGD
jgi:hypothetical protein